MHFYNGYIVLPSLYFPLAWKDRFDFLEDCLEQGAEGGDRPPPPLCFNPETALFRGPPPPATATLFTALLGWAQAPRLPVRLRTSSPRGDLPLSSYKHLEAFKATICPPNSCYTGLLNVSPGRDNSQGRSNL